jgi:hypothetical protein
MVSNGYAQATGWGFDPCRLLGRTLMKTIGIDVLNASTTNFIANDLTVRIRKLRWMGMEDEAKALEQELKASPATEIDSVLAAPRNTD